jgi:hypothetical protein
MLFLIDTIECLYHMGEKERIKKMANEVNISDKLLLAISLILIILAFVLFSA